MSEREDSAPPKLLIIPRPPAVGFVARRDVQGRGLVELLSEELAPLKNQSVTLGGPGGVGKTVLAAEIARRLNSSFSGRIVWVSADGRLNFNISTLLDEIAIQLGRPDLRTLALSARYEQVHALVAAQPSLIILDNYETIAPEEQKRIGDWLALAHCSALFTSRHPITETTHTPISTMSRDEAEEFLSKIIGQTQDQQVFSAEVRERVYVTAEANPYVMQWVVAQIADAKEPATVFEELAGGGGDAAERVFARSFDLPRVGDDGRAALLALSLFAPDASREALAEVAGLGEDRKRLDEATGHLHALWLVKGVDGNRRFAVEGLTRTLAAARRSKDPRDDEFRRRFVAYFLRYALEREDPTPENYDALEAEKDNLMVAAESAFASGDWGSVMRMASALASPVTGMLSVRGYWDEATRLSEQAFQAAHSSEDERMIAGYSHNLAVMYANRGELAEARRLYEESVEIDKELGNRSGLAITLHQLALLAQNQGELNEARRLYEESLEISKRLGDQRGVAATLHQLGRLTQDQGVMLEARRLYGESIEISKSLGNKSDIARTTSQLGIVHLLLGEFEEAEAKYKESLVIRRQLGDQQGIAVGLHQLGILAEDKGDTEKAAQLFREALSIFERLGSPDAEIARRSLARMGGEGS